MNWSFLSLANAINKDNLIIKISDYDFFEPSFLLWILSLYKSKQTKVDCTNINSDINNYLNRIDFYKYLSIECNSINRKKSDNLIEITPITKETSWWDTDQNSKKNN